MLEELVFLPNGGFGLPALCELLIKPAVMRGKADLRT